MNQENENVEFRRSFRGYNIEEVDEYIDTLKNDIEDLKADTSELYRRFEAVSCELEKYKNAEKLSGDIVGDANGKADEIIKEAKNKAAHILIKTSKQCNRIVANMVHQVETQKKIYDTAKKEVLIFRSELFDKYGEHIRKINALAEAAGGLGADELSEGEIEEYLSVLDRDASFDEALKLKTDWGIGREEPAVEESSERIYNKEKVQSKPETAEKPAEAKPHDNNVDPLVTAVRGTPSGSFEEGLFSEIFESAEDDTPAIADEDIEAEDDIEAEREDIFSETENMLRDLKLSVGEEQITDDATGVADDDIPASVENIFGRGTQDLDFDNAFEDKHVSVEKTDKAENDNSYGFSLNTEGVDEPEDDDSDEFYSDDDDGDLGGTYIPDELMEVLRGSETEEKSSKGKRWKTKKSMSITDEFDAVKYDDEE